MMLELESLATVGAFEATEDGGLIVGDQVALQIFLIIISMKGGAQISAYQWTGVSRRLGGGEVV